MFRDLLKKSSGVFGKTGLSCEWLLNRLRGMNARACLLALLTPLLSSQAIEINLVYQDPADPFFTSVAKDTMQKAAADVSYAITTALNGISQDVYSGTNGSTTATVDWRLSYTDPNDGTTVVTLNTFSLLPDQITIYVGSRSIPGSTLGIGGPGGIGYSLTGGGSSSQWVGAVDNMEAASNASMVRDGPVRGTFSGSGTLGGTTATFDLDYGYFIGTLAIDSSAVWNLDYDVLPVVGQSDLYSVAVHELLHGIGFGIGQTWDDHVDGLDWTGEAVIELLGTGADVLSAGQDHIAEGLTGMPLVDGVWQVGVSQEALMDPSLTSGTRKYITDLDLAFLRDMGWETQVIPEPASALLVLAGGVAVFIRRRRRESMRPPQG
jgi:hypothetical protein